MSLSRALGWATAQTAARIAAGFFSAKISALFLGPPGVALVGQVGNFIQLTQSVVCNGANTAIVNLSAQRSDTAARRDLWSTAIQLVLFVGLLLVLIVAFLSLPLASWLLSNRGYWPVIIAAGLATIPIVAESVIQGALNGLKRIDLLGKAAVISTVLEAVLFAALVFTFGIWGGLFGISAIYLVKLGVTCAAAFLSGAVRVSDLVGRFNPRTAREITAFYPMLIAHSIAQPLAQIGVRSLVIERLSLDQAGYLQAAWRLSDMYMSVLTASLGMYFMAHYSGLSTAADRTSILRKTVLQVFVLVSLAATTIYLLRELIVTIVLTRQFMPMTALLPLQLLGDVSRIAGYPMQMALVAERRTPWFIAVAVSGPAVFVSLSALWLSDHQSQAAPMAYASSQLLVLFILAFALRKTLIGKTSEF